MILKLKDVPGLLIKQKTVHEGHWVDNLFCRQCNKNLTKIECFDMGFNWYGCEQGEKGLTLNREKLAKELCFADGFSSKSGMKDKLWQVTREKEYYFRVADAILQSLPEIIESVKE